MTLREIESQINRINLIKLAYEANFKYYTKKLIKREVTVKQALSSINNIKEKYHERRN